MSINVFHQPYYKKSSCTQTLMCVPFAMFAIGDHTVSTPTYKGLSNILVDLYYHPV